MVFTSVTALDLHASESTIVGRGRARELGLQHPWDRGPKLSVLQMCTCHSSRNSHSPHKLGPRLLVTENNPNSPIMSQIPLIYLTHVLCEVAKIIWKLNNLSSSKPESIWATMEL